jgi:hypothetical protein
MGNSVAARNATVDALAAATWVSLHTGDPGTTGANEVVPAPYARKQTIFAAAAGGSRVGSQVAIDVAAGGPYTHFGLWTASSGGTFYTGGLLSNAESYGGVGVLRVTPTLTAAA